MWEQRWHPLREEWVIIAAHRQHRPWSGEEVRHGQVPLPTYVEDCYLCPGNRRVDGQRNPNYRQTFVFDNDLPCVAPDAPAARPPSSPLYRTAHISIAADEISPEQVVEAVLQAVASHGRHS